MVFGGGVGIDQPRKGARALGRRMSPAPHYYNRRYAMDIAMLEEVIGKFGFPIVCCAVLFWDNFKQRQQHKEESIKWTEALNNNTMVMERLVERLER